MQLRNYNGFRMNIAFIIFIYHSFFTLTKLGRCTFCLKSLAELSEMKAIFFIHINYPFKNKLVTLLGEFMVYNSTIPQSERLPTSFSSVFLQDRKGKNIKPIKTTNSIYYCTAVKENKVWLFKAWIYIFQLLS